MADTWDDESLDINVTILLRQLPNDEERQRLIDCLTYIHIRTKLASLDCEWDYQHQWWATSIEPYTWHGHYLDNVEYPSSMLLE